MKAKIKNANSKQLFRPGWASSAECMPHRKEKPTPVYKVLVVMTSEMGSARLSRFARIPLPPFEQAMLMSRPESNQDETAVHGILVPRASNPLRYLKRPGSPGNKDVAATPPVIWLCPCVRFWPNRILDPSAYSSDLARIRALGSRMAKLRKRVLGNINI